VRLLTPKEIKIGLLPNLFQLIKVGFGTLRFVTQRVLFGIPDLQQPKRIKKLTAYIQENIKAYLFVWIFKEYSIVRSHCFVSLFAPMKGIEESLINLLQWMLWNLNCDSHIKGFERFTDSWQSRLYCAPEILNEDRKKHLESGSVCNSGHLFIYSFFSIGMESLSNNGVLGYSLWILFFNKDVNGTALRVLFAIGTNSNLLKISLTLWANKSFSPKSTYIVVLHLQKNKEWFSQLH